MRRNVPGTSPWEALVGYSRAVRAGPYVHVAGTTATVDGQVQHVGDAAGQTRVALAIIAAALEQAGATLEQVVRTRLYVTDISRWEEIGRAHGEVFGQIRPAASMVQVAALIDPQHLVEIEADGRLYRLEAGSSGLVDCSPSSSGGEGQRSCCPRRTRCSSAPLRAGSSPVTVCHSSRVSMPK